MKKLVAILSFAGILTPGLVLAADDDLVVVVNKSNPVENVTKVQLRKMLLGEQSSWSSGKKVSVILRSPGEPERGGVLRAVCGMKEDDFNQHLMHADFNGGDATPPKALGSAAAVRQLVASIPGGIGFLRSADVNDSVKAVKVDGLSAGEPGYLIKAGK